MLSLEFYIFVIKYFESGKSLTWIYKCCQLEDEPGKKLQTFQHLMEV